MSHKTDKTMVKKLDYSDVPDGFTHCMNASCQMADSCLRYQARQYIPVSCKTIKVINPTLVLSDGKCSAYLSETDLRYAYGVDHLYDTILYGVAIQIKKQLIDIFGKNMYYRFKRKEKCFTPKDQELVARVFKQFGVEEQPRFDYYVSGYKWCEKKE